MTLPVFAGQRGHAAILRWYEGNGIFADEELRAWVLDGGTQFKPGGPDSTWQSPERKQLTNEDLRRAVPMLGAAVDINLQYASPRAAPASRARRFRLSRARASTPFSLSSGPTT